VIWGLKIFASFRESLPSFTGKAGPLSPGLYAKPGDGCSPMASSRNMQHEISYYVWKRKGSLISLPGCGPRITSNEKPSLRLHCSVRALWEASSAGMAKFLCG